MVVVKKTQKRMKITFKGIIDFVHCVCVCVSKQCTFVHVAVTGRVSYSEHYSEFISGFSVRRNKWPVKYFSQIN